MTAGRERAATAGERPDRAAITWIVLAAVTRVIAAFALGDTFHFVDETLYVDAARHLLAGEGFGESYRNVPAQPVWLAVLAAPWPERLVWLRAAHAIATGVLGGLAIHALGTRLVGAAATRVALAFYACDPLLVVAGGLLYPEASATVMLAATLLAAVIASERDDARVTAASGMLLGFTMLFRPVAVVLVPVFVLWIATVTATAARRRLAHALAFTITCGLGVAPWALSNLVHHGDVVPRGMAGLQNAPVSEKDIGDYGLAGSLAHRTMAEPTEVASRVVRELGHFWEPYPMRLTTDQPHARTELHELDTRLPRETTFPPGLRDVVSAVSYGVEITLALVGLALAGRGRRAAVVLIVGVALAYGLGYALFIAKLRYRIVVMPGVFLLAGLGVMRLRARIGVTASDVVATAEPHR